LILWEIEVEDFCDSPCRVPCGRVICFVAAKAVVVISFLMQNGAGDNGPPLPMHDQCQFCAACTLGCLRKYLDAGADTVVRFSYYP
jgi:hypothetical protein